MINAIVQARMNSSRLPGKVLMKIGALALIDYLIIALKHCIMIDKIIVAVPSGDDALQKHLKGKCIVVTGSEEDVAGRFIKALKEYPCDGFVRICADSPLIDFSMVDAVAVTLKTSRIATTVGGGWPHGQQVEGFSTEMFLSEEIIDREHVTTQFYQPPHHPMVLLNPGPTGISLVVDTQKDFDRVRELIEKADYCPWEYTFEELR